jgi:hypothetical protein
MSAVAEIVHSINFDPEWKRIEVLGHCLLESAAGREPTDSLVERLRDLQQQVQHLRTENSHWRQLPVDGLPEISFDLMAAVYAPVVSPNAALLYQDLLQNKDIVPTLAFLHRLLVLDDAEYYEARHLLSSEGELVKRGLVSVDGDGPLQRLLPHPAIMAIVTGLPQQCPSIPGAICIDDKAGWDDLILPAPQRRMLHEFLMWIRYRDRVVEEWGGRAAGGPIALLSGPSGTGKTFAASVIATELGWPLYRVDLGALVSKYIGETEKNLNALFDAVHGRDILLQFDEVDALMGKRGEVKDARDRYANMEVSHLLSRIEQHQGPCILTTNLRKHIDQAFQRRFHFVITFPRPEVRERLALWRCLIPRRAPLADDLDYQMLSEAVTLTGGEIRNAANHAAVLAASEDRPIGLEQIAIGVWRVLQKSDGKTRSNQLRQLAEYLPKEILQGEEA